MVRFGHDRYDHLTVFHFTTSHVLAFGEVPATLPEGAVVLETTSDGRRLMVRLGLFGGGQRILVFDLNSGARLGAFTFDRGGSSE